MTAAAVDSWTISHSLINLFFFSIVIERTLTTVNLVQLWQCGRVFLQVTLVTDHSLTLIFAINILIMLFNKNYFYFTHRILPLFIPSFLHTSSEQQAQEAKGIAMLRGTSAH